MLTQKACTKCGKVKNLEEFHKHPLGKFGRAPRCRACMSNYQMRRYYLKKALLEEEWARQEGAAGGFSPELRASIAELFEPEETTSAGSSTESPVSEGQQGPEADRTAP